MCAEAASALPAFLLDADDGAEAPMPDTTPSSALQQEVKSDGKLKKRLLRVGLVGIPNAGKSTLTNWLVGGTVSAVSIRPETTRKVALGAFHDASTQVRRQRRVYTASCWHNTSAGPDAELSCP